MSTNTQNLLVKTPSTPPASGKTGGGLGVNLSSGMEAAVTAALSFLEQVLCKVNYQELRQTQLMANANKLASENSATNIKNGGQQQFIEALASGIGTFAGAGLTLGTVAYGYLRDPYKAQIEQVKQEEEGVQNYQKSLPKTFNPAVDEGAGQQEPQVQGPKTKAEAEAEQAAAKAKEDHAQRVEDKVQALKKQKSFVDENGRAAKVSQEKGADQAESEQDLISAMTKKQVTEVNEALEKQLDNLSQRKLSLADKSSKRQQTAATIGQGFNGLATGAGTAGAAYTKKLQAEDQAAGQLSNSASQGMQSIMSQMLKTANDALSQAQQTIQTFATVSNGNKFQG